MNKKAVLRLNTAKLSGLHSSASSLRWTFLQGGKEESQSSAWMPTEEDGLKMCFIKSVYKIVLLETQHHWCLVPYDFSVLEIWTMRPGAVMLQTALNQIQVLTKQKEIWPPVMYNLLMLSFNIVYNPVSLFTSSRFRKLANSSIDSILLKACMLLPNFQIRQILPKTGANITFNHSSLLTRHRIRISAALCRLARSRTHHLWSNHLKFSLP